MKIIHCALLGIASLVPVFGGAETARADHPDRHLEKLSDRLEDNVEDLVREMSRNHRDKPGFKETYREVKAMEDMADDIEDVLDDRRLDVRRLRRDVDRLDELMHHVQDDVAAWGRIRYVSPYRAGGYGGGYPGGHVVHRFGGYVQPHHGHFAPPRHGDTRTLTRLLAEMEETLHHLRSDVFGRR